MPSSPRPRVYHCLASRQGFLRDHSDDLIHDASGLWTDDAAHSLRFLTGDTAQARVKLLAHALPELDIRLVTFHYASPGVWVPADD